MFIHIKRINQARVTPSAPLCLFTFIALLALSVLAPVSSSSPANFDKPLHDVEIDWFYMNTFPLVDLWGPVSVWTLLIFITVSLTLLPFIPWPARNRLATAVVDPEYCNGCGWCATDCPFEAIQMGQHEMRKNRRQAFVTTDACVSCGICVGACPSVTPFKSVHKSDTGIAMPDSDTTAILTNIRKRVVSTKSEKPILLFGCAHGTDVSRFENQDVVTQQFECLGQLPPSYIDFLCRKENISKVLLTGCATGNCYQRLGNEIEAERIARNRYPHLRYLDARKKVEQLWVGAGREDNIQRKIEEARCDRKLAS